MRFFQDAPLPTNLYRADRALSLELARRLDPALLDTLRPRLEALGEATAGELARLAEEAEAHPPEHWPFDPWGRRVDEIRTAPAWDALKAFSARYGLVAAGYEARFGAAARVVQTALLHLFSGSSATFACPLAMTDAAARVLIERAPASLRERLVPRLLATEPADFITSGQWMTERGGGSDVGTGTETIARRVAEEDAGEEERYALYGAKWFTSATTSEMALTLARVEDDAGRVPEGSRGLTLFCVELSRDAQGALEGIRVERLKDKLGTRALPTAELTLEGARATRLGELGRGVANISGMLNVTRYYNAVASASGMARGVFLARDFAQRRRAFGRPIAEQPLHARTLDELEARTAGALALCFEVAHLLGRVEAREADESEASRLRALVPVAKLTLGKEAVAVASESLECFGGAGYVEDTGLPRLLRDAQVLPIWEGTTNVLSLDLLRAEAKSGGVRALLEDLHARAARLEEAGGAVPLAPLARALTRVAELAAGPPELVALEARRIGLGLGLVTASLSLAESAAWAQRHAEGHAEAAARRAQDAMRVWHEPPA